MEKVQKVVQSINPIGEPDQYGNLAFNVAFTDNTSGFFKCKEQNLFTVGQSATFYFGKQVGKSGKEYYKIERVEKHENEFNNPQKKSEKYSRTEEDTIQLQRSVAIKAACDLLQGSSNNTPERAIEAAEAFFDYIAFGVTDKNGNEVKQAAEQAQQFVQNTAPMNQPPTDELPF